MPGRTLVAHGAACNKGKHMKKATKEAVLDASQRINDLIAKLGDWRGKMLARLRKIILDAAPELIEEWKWGTAVWTHKGLVCSAGAFKDHVKLNFFKGASLKDPKRLFNAGLGAKATRAIDFHEEDALDGSALKALVREAVACNLAAGTNK
jgi:hypothetical protein